MEYNQYMNTASLHFIKTQMNILASLKWKEQQHTAAAAAAAVVRAKSFRNETLVMQQHWDGCGNTQPVATSCSGDNKMADKK